MKIHRFYLFFLFILVWSCSQSEKTSNLPELTFEVKPELRGSPFLSPKLGIVFYPPKNWELIDQNLMNAFKQKVTYIPALVHLIPEAVFLKRNNGSCAILSSLAKPRNLKEIASIYQKSLSKKYPSLKTGIYRYRDFVIYQYLIVDAKQVVFKLLVYYPRGIIFQIDYITPLTTYKSEVKGIETSIGSLAKLTPK